MLHQPNPIFDSVYSVPALHLDGHLADLARDEDAYFDGGLQIIEVHHFGSVDVHQQLRNIPEDRLQDSWQLSKAEMFVVALGLVYFALHLDM